MSATSSKPTRIRPSSDDLAKAEQIRALIAKDGFDEDGTGSAVLEAFNSLPDSIDVREWLKVGFGKDPRWQISLVERLTRCDSIGALRLLVRENTRGATLEQMCSVYRKAQYQSDLECLSLLAVSVLEASPGGVALALKLEPQHKSLTDLTKLHIFGSSMATLHYVALHHGVRGEGAWSQNYLNCARLLLEHGAPVLHYPMGDGSVAAAFFGGAGFGSSWKGDVGFVVEMAKRYMDAGLLDPNKPLPSNLTPFGGQLPLAATLRQKNAHGARFLIANGANVQASLPDGCTDLVELARKTWDDPEMVALITTGLMEQRIATASTEHGLEVATRPMRAGRHGL